MIKKLAVLGDSHTRSFSFRENVYPIFLDEGRKINLNTNHVNYVISQSNKVKNKLNLLENVIYFIKLGEPDIRYQLNNDWHVQASDFVYEGKINYEYLDLCISNYKKIIDNLPFIDYILTPTTAYKPSLDSLKYFNDGIKKIFGDKVVDIQSKTLGQTEVLDEYKGSDRDPIHLNSNISNLFLDELVKRNIINSSDLNFYKRNQKESFNSKDLKKLFMTNRFGTLTFK